MPGPNRPEIGVPSVQGPSNEQIQAGIVDVPKPPEILAIEKKLGREVEPVYAQGTIYRGSGGASQTLDYGPPVGYRYDNGQSQYVNFDTKGTQTSIQQRGGEFKQLLPILAAVFLPGVGSAIANALLDAGIVTSEVAANVIGNAIANTASSVAQGQPFDKALTNAIVGAAVSTGSVAVAKEVNSFIGHPAVTDALISAAGSAVKTAAAGGTEQDIINNMTGALAGSAASSAYQLGGKDYTQQTGRVIGSTVAGAVTGGGVGAITGALGELGSQSKGKVAKTIEDTFRGTTDTGALPASQVAAMTPETDAGAATGDLAPVTVTGKTPSDVTGTNIISPNAITSTPVTAPAAELPLVTVTGQRNSDITDTDIIDTIAAEKKPDAVLQDVTVTGKKEELPSLAPVTITGKREEPLALEPVTITGKKDGELEPVTITGKRDGELDPVTITGKADEPDATTEETAPKDKPYKPDLFILGGKKPKAPTNSVLGQALGTTTGLTASRGAGEIEDPSTGKKKRKVWNEETLRLKDALGV